MRPALVRSVKVSAGVLIVSFMWPSEGTAILAASVLFWQFQAGQFRQRMGAVLIGLGLGIAVMGVLQYHVVWEQRAEWYLERMTAIEAWQQAERRGCRLWPEDFGWWQPARGLRRLG